MICHEYKCIFIHIPKAAGQSVEHYFLNKLGLDWNSRSPLLLRKNDEPKAGPPTLAHMRAIDYIKYHYISRELYDQYFTFSFVRNPWSRAVSTYKFLGYDRIMNFERYLSRQMGYLLETKRGAVMPQYEMLYDNGEKMVDFIGRFECINEDFAEVCRRLGFEDTVLPHINKGKQYSNKGLMSLVKRPGLIFQFTLKRPNFKDYRDYYTEKSKKLVSQIYKDDINCFGYTF